MGLRIAEVPVDWVDDPNSKVDIVDTAMKDLQGCWRVGRALAKGDLPVADLRRTLGRNRFRRSRRWPACRGGWSGCWSASP